MFVCVCVCFCVFFFFLCDLLYKNTCCGYPFELHQQVDAIQMGTLNICLYKEVDKKIHWLKSEDSEIGVCAVIRLNTVCDQSLWFCWLIWVSLLWYAQRHYFSWWGSNYYNFLSLPNGVYKTTVSFYAIKIKHILLLIIPFDLDANDNVFITKTLFIIKICRL